MVGTSNNVSSGCGISGSEPKMTDLLPAPFLYSFLVASPSAKVHDACVLGAGWTYQDGLLGLTRVAVKELSLNYHGGGI